MGWAQNSREEKHGSSLTNCKMDTTLTLCASFLIYETIITTSQGCEMKEIHRKYLAQHTVTSSLSSKDGDGDPCVILIKLPLSTGSHSTYWVYIKFWFFPYLSISSCPFWLRTQWAQNLEPVGLGSGSSSATSWVTSGESLTSQTWKFPCHVLCPCRASETGRSLWRGGETDARQRHEARGTGR